MKKIMLLVSICFIFSSVSYAAKNEGAGLPKAKILAHLDKKMAHLKSHRSCVVAASDKAAVKKCMVSHKEKMQSLKMGKRAGVKSKNKARK